MNLIYASNLHVGGGVQVAASFVDEMIVAQKFAYHVAVSTRVLENLSYDYQFCVEKFEKFWVVDDLSWPAYFSPRPWHKYQYQTCFTVFGPRFARVTCNYSIMGFAQPWLVFDTADLIKVTGLPKYLFLKLKFSALKRLFDLADLLVVETATVAGRLRDSRTVQTIAVVPNTVSNAFLESSRLRPKKLIGRRGVLKFGVVGRGYPHKNLAILKRVDLILKRDHGLDCDFIFTLSDEELKQHNFTNISNFYSTSQISLQELGAVYAQFDLLICPSLLECFSASPIEALAVGCPVVCSDRPFYTELLGDLATYFDPNDAADIAATVVQVLKNKLVVDSSTTSKMMDRVSISPADRCLRYLKLVEEGFRLCKKNCRK